jgi:arsenate reductase
VFNVLFICTGNSARSIMAEAVLNRAGQGRFRTFSAGSRAEGPHIHPYAIDLLKRLHYDVSNVRSKSWTEFTGPDAPKLDFAFTLCDDAAAEACPVWPGQPMTAHWGLPDPATKIGTEAEMRLRVRRYDAHAYEPHQHFRQSADEIARRARVAETVGRHRQEQRQSV